MDDDFKRISGALNDRLKQTCHRLGLDVTNAAQRHVCERIVHHWNAGMGAAPVMLCGGLLYPQQFRPTADADLRVVRRYSDEELRNGMTIIAAMLRAEGIDLRAVKPLRELDVDAAGPVTRLSFEAYCGGVRANSHLDLSLAVGPLAMPDARDVVMTEFPSFMTKGPSYRALAQPLETAIAEKWIAVVTKRRDDLRMKHEADLLLLSCQDNVDIHKVARELLRTCRHRGIDENVLAGTPASMSFPAWNHRRRAWSEACRDRRLRMVLKVGFGEFHSNWQSVKSAVEFARKQELLRKLRTRDSRGDRINIHFGRPEPTFEGNVVAFRPR